MALFKKEICRHCGKEVGMAKTKLADGNYLCWDCAEKCTRQFETQYLSKHTYEEYCEYLEHKEKNREKLKQFHQTLSYYDTVFVDMDREWIIFDKSYKYQSDEERLKANPEVFDFKDLRYFDFFTKIKSTKEESLVNVKGKMDLTLTVAFDHKWYPCAFKDKVLKNSKFKGNLTSLFSDKIEFRKSQIEEDLPFLLLHILHTAAETRYPVSLGGKLALKEIDLEPYAPFFEKMFELKELGIFDSFELSDRLNEITESIVIKNQIKKRFGKK